MKKLATFPFLIDPYSALMPIAAAELMVAALIASSGSKRILIQASDTTNFISPDGVEPGL